MIACHRIKRRQLVSQKPKPAAGVFRVKPGVRIKALMTVIMAVIVLMTVFMPRQIARRAKGNPLAQFKNAGFLGRQKLDHPRACRH